MILSAERMKELRQLFVQSGIHLDDEASYEAALAILRFALVQINKETSKELNDE